MTIHIDQISYVKHVLDPLYVFSTLFGCLGGGKGLGHNLVMHGNSKMEIFKPDFLIFWPFSMIRYPSQSLI